MKTTEARARIQLKNILFLTDFSAAANAAVPYATELAKRYGARIHTLHVRTPIIYPMTPPHTWPATEEAAAIEAQQQKRELTLLFSGIHPHITVKEGDLPSNLASTIGEEHIDLVVMGTRGRSGIGKLLLGSTAEETFRQAPCPVLTVGPHSPVRPDPGGEFTRILFATDFSPESGAAAAYAVSLAQEFQARLTLLHVIEEAKSNELVRPADVMASSMRLLRDLVPAEAELWCVPEYVIEYGGAAEKILDVATRCKADLIVLGARRPSGVPGAASHLPIATAHKVVSDATCPVLTIRH
jgi:nucleotide-binding universal stress UspA family protein